MVGSRFLTVWFSSVQFSHSVVSNCCSPCMGCSVPGFPVHHQLLELAQTQIHQVSDAIHPSHSLSSLLLLPSIFSSIRGYLKSQSYASGDQSVGASASASVLPTNIQDWFPLGWTGWISLQSKELLRVFSNTTVQKQQFFSTQPSLWSKSHIHTWLLENHSFD